MKALTLTSGGQVFFTVCVEIGSQPDQAVNQFLECGEYMAVSVITCLFCDGVARRSCVIDVC